MADLHTDLVVDSRQIDFDIIAVVFDIVTHRILYSWFG